MSFFLEIQLEIVKKLNSFIAKLFKNRFTITFFSNWINAFQMFFSCQQKFMDLVKFSRHFFAHFHRLNVNYMVIKIQFKNKLFQKKKCKNCKTRKLSENLSTNYKFWLGREKPGKSCLLFMNMKCIKKHFVSYFISVVTS